MGGDAQEDSWREDLEEDEKQGRSWTNAPSLQPELREYYEEYLQGKLEQENFQNHR